MKNRHLVFILPFFACIFAFLSCQNGPCEDVDCSAIPIEIDAEVDSCCFSYSDEFFAVSKPSYPGTVSESMDLNMDGIDDINFWASYSSSPGGWSYSRVEILLLETTHYAADSDGKVKQFDEGEPLIPENEIWSDSSQAFGNGSYEGWAANDEVKGMAVRMENGNGEYLYGWVMLSLNYVSKRVKIFRWAFQR